MEKILICQFRTTRENVPKYIKYQPHLEFLQEYNIGAHISPEHLKHDIKCIVLNLNYTNELLHFCGDA